MIAAILSAATLAASVVPPPEALVRALHAAAPQSVTRVAIVAYHPSVPAGCHVDSAEVAGAVDGSGLVSVRMVGTSANGLDCEGWAQVQVRVSGSAWVTRRTIAAGENLANAVTQTERELPRGSRPVEKLTGDEVARLSLPAGAIVEEGQVQRGGPIPGKRIAVVLHVGGLSIETTGEVLPCAASKACARLPSGKRVEGTFSGSQIIVEVQ